MCPVRNNRVINASGARLKSGPKYVRRWTNWSTKASTSGGLLVCELGLHNGIVVSHHDTQNY